MTKRNQLTPFQREILAPLIGKIVTGIRYEKSPDSKLFSDKLSLRMRPLEQLDSELTLGIYYKLYLPENPEPALSLSINLLTTEEIEYLPPLLGFQSAEFEILQQFLRQPVNGFHLLPNQSIVVIFAQQSLIFELDQDQSGDLHLGWALD